jgi:c-di-GMP-binding flagellar brake protein YcgR
MQGSVLDLKFRLFNDDRLISVQAEVRYVQEGVGMGVRFTNLKAEDRERIKKFIGRF